MLTPEQLAKRRTGIGSTDIGIIAGVSPYGSSYEVWADKLGKLKPREDTEPMYWGRMLEEVILQRYRRDVDSHFKALPWQETVAHRDDRLLVCTPDAKVINPATYDILHGVEVKTAASYDQAQRFGQAGDEVPEEYLVQCQWCMLITGLKRWDMAVLLAGYHGFEYRCYDLEANPDLQQKLRIIAHDFWDKYVTAKVQPPVDGSGATRDALRSVWPRSAARIITATDDQDDWAMELATATETLRRAEAQKELAQQKLKASMGEAEKIQGEDWSATWKSDKRGHRVFRPWFKK